MGSRIRIIYNVFIAFILLVDGITFMGIIFDFSSMRNLTGILTFWTIPFLFIAGLYWFGRKFMYVENHGFPAHFFTFTGLFLAFYFPKLLYVAILLVENICVAFVFSILKLLSEPGDFTDYYSQTFLNSISLFILPLAGISFLVITGGMLFGRFNFRLRELETGFPDLPSSFDGFSILHISDLHLGSLTGYMEKIRKAINMINQADADLILFTGDLVNNVAEETHGWIELLAEMQSRHGKFAILGNHDYGEYYNWPDEVSKQANMDRLIQAHEAAGFKLLLNESAKVRLGEDEITLLGVENWGLPPFRQYGDLEKALENTGKNDFFILLSHDPTHWDEEVALKTRIQLTLSGHTHGFQFGIRTRCFKWSPVQIKYPRWIGLYKQGHQILHVSPGLGYIGYAGRIGIPPEITLITLRRTTC